MGGCTLPGLFLERPTGISTLTSGRLPILISGGLSGAAAKLRELGFEVQGLGDDHDV